MSILNYKDFWTKSKSIIEYFQELNKIDFEFMLLTDEHIELIKCMDGLAEIVPYITNHTLSFERKLINDDEGMKKDLKAFWGKAEAEYKSDPSVQYQLAFKIAEKSGILPFMIKQEKAEFAAKAKAEKLVNDYNEAHEINDAMSTGVNEQNLVAFDEASAA